MIFDFDALESAITEDTKVFYLCNPNNPAGIATYAESKEWKQQLLAYLKENREKFFNRWKRLWR